MYIQGIERLLGSDILDLHVRGNSGRIELLGMGTYDAHLNQRRAYSAQITGHRILESISIDIYLSTMNPMPIFLSFPRALLLRRRVE